MDTTVLCKRSSDAITSANCPLFVVGDARELLKYVGKNTVDLVVTSPPYPMIAMWDEAFAEMSDAVLPADKWDKDNVMNMFEAMHIELDRVWEQLFEATKPGAIVVINIGDATRSVDKRFHLFPNGARTTMGMMYAGFTPLPNIYWKKPTNKPNAFLGSGFYPVNAYVTIDCEHILIFRNSDKRTFSPKDPNREASKFSKDERNLWFSQLWEVPGARQEVVDGRRTAAFRSELPERLIKMFSVRGDLVLDPFVGTGTTAIAAVKLERRAVGLDIQEAFITFARKEMSPPPVTHLFKRSKSVVGTLP